ncbi:hypothetical protein DRN63_03665 [Nanoarchaeota archaeon]|nr:MAG: hypothetical protein DRN63_03665 [Nanoarchaeota archaeon]
MGEFEVPEEVKGILAPGENVLCALKQRMIALEKPKYIIVTDKRVIYLDRKLLGRYEIIDFPYKRLKEVWFRFGKFGSKFILKREDGRMVELEWLKKDGALEVLDAIRKAIQAVAVEPISIEKHKKLIGEEWFIRKPMEVVSRAVITHQGEPEEDIAVKLRKLKALLDEGLITKEEYEEKRKELLSKL